MTSFTTVHRWNSLTCPPLGFLFNFLLLWLILHRTPKEMRVHSRILLQTCLFDTVLLALQCIGQNAFTNDAKTGQLVVFYDGYFVRLLKPLLLPSFLHYFGCVWLAMHNLSIFGIAVQFIYRYLVLNRNVKTTLRRYLLLLLCPALYVFGTSTAIMVGTKVTFNRQPNVTRERFAPFVDFDQQPLHCTAEFEGINNAAQVSITMNSVLMLIAYALICCCGWMMVRFVSKNASLNGKLKAFNRQLTKSLIILAFFPLCISLLTLATSFCFLKAKSTTEDVGGGVTDSDDWKSLELELYFALPFHWLPVLNPLAAIFINRPYRDALIGKFVKISPTTT